MTRHLRLLAAAMVLASVSPAWADAEGDALKAQMLEAYQNTRTYQATSQIEFRKQQGRWRSSEAGDYKITFDRAAGKLLIDKPDMLIVIDGEKLRLKSDQVSDRHLETAAPVPLSYETITAAVPYLKKPSLPDVAFLLAADPVAALNGGKPVDVKAMPPEANDPQHRPGLRLITQEGRITLRLDPATHLVTSVAIELKLPPDPDDPAAAAASASLHYEFAVEKRNEPLDASAFAFDTANSTAVASLKDYEGGGDEKNPLEGAAAPPIDLKTLDNHDVNLAGDGVVILDFWASWCRFCPESLASLQKVADWAQKEHKPVAAFGINVRETPERAKAFWTKAAIRFPLALDADGEIAESYHVQGLPQTVVIHKGKVVKIMAGLDPDEEEHLKQIVEKLLKQDKPTEPAAPSTKD